MNSRLAFPILICLAFVGSPLTADMDDILSDLSSRPETAYLQKNGNDLLPMEQRTRPGIVVLQKTIDGVRLHGGRVTVLMNENGKIEEVIDDSSANLERRFGNPAVDAAMAELVVRGEMDRLKAIAQASEIVWFRLGDTARLAWEVNTSVAPLDQPVSPTNLISVVDAETGELLSQHQEDSNDYYENQGTGIYPRIVINNAVGAAGSRAYAVPFESTVEVDFGCTGVLIAPNTVLCARHCGVTPGSPVRFGTNLNSPILTRTVQSSFLPDGGGSLLDGGDVSILRLTANVPSNVATPMRLIDATNDLEDMLCSMTGYGFNGIGSQGHNFSSDNRRWGGENIIDRYGSPVFGGGGSNIISTDFDNGSSGANTIPGSDPSPIEFEATTAPGDSGGPVMVQQNGEWLVAGVLSGGTTSTSTYGDISWWTGTAIYRQAIEARGGEFAEDEPVFLGDINCDGDVNLLDISPFVALVSSGTYFEKADINQDGVVNLLDVNGFIELLGG